MTISSSNYDISYSGNGSTTTFAYNFRIFANTDLKVYVDSTLKTLTTDYTVTGVDSEGGGNVVFGTAPANGTTVYISRSNIAYTQETDYTEQGPFPAESHETALDKLTTEAQQVKLITDKCLKLPFQETLNTQIETVTNRADTYLGFDANGNLKYSDLSSVSGEFLQAGTGAVSRGYQSKNRDVVSVQDFGALGDGVTDDTSAFNLAIATGKHVVVPYTEDGYVVNNITVVTNMSIAGEKSGVSNGPKLIVTTNSAGAFLHTGSSPLFQIHIANFVIEAGSGVTGAMGYKQSDKSVYSAYVRFEGIETSGNLLYGYDGFFIFTDWWQCRDGYIGNAGAQGHGFLRNEPAAWNQSNQANVNSIKHTQIFRSISGTTTISAAADIGRGALWTFEHCDFEDLDVQAIRARAVYNITVKNCWCEAVAAAQLFTVDIDPSAIQGSRPFLVEGCYLSLDSTTTYAAFLGAASFILFKNTFFVGVGSGVVLANAAGSVTGCENSNNVIGAGAAGFLAGVNTDTFDANGVRYLNGAADNSSGAKLQASGLISSTAGLLTKYNVTINSAGYTTIGTANLIGVLAFVNGYNTSGGSQGWWLLAFRDTTVTTIASSDNTSTTPLFQVSSGNLQMATTTGTLAVNSTILC